MPLGLSAADRKLLVIGGALLLLMLGGTIVLSPPAPESASPDASTYSGLPGGAEAAYLLLSQLHYPVRRWEDSPAVLPSNPQNILLILAEPTQMPSEGERKLIADFVRRGGHLLFTGAALARFFPDVTLSPSGPDRERKTFPPNIPNALSRGAQRVTMQPEAAWEKLDESQWVLYGDAGSGVVVSWSLGLGEIIWWADPTPLTNAGITLDDNLAFFLNSVSGRISDAPREIYWDEYFHGQRASLWSYIGRTSLAWGLAQCGLLALAVILTFSRRSGPIYAPARVSRLSPLEFVDTLGGLYERARASPTAVSVSRQRLRFLLARQLGLPSDTPDAEMARQAGQRLGWKGAELADVLSRAAAAVTATDLKPREALDLVQALERHAAMLEVRAPFRQEES